MMNHPEYKSRLKELGCIVVIPTYNNVGTICQVVDSVRCYSDDIMVVKSLASASALLAEKDAISGML